MPQELSLYSEGYQVYVVSVRPPGQGPGPEKGTRDEAEANKNPISQVERWGLFLLLAFDPI
jgi:hypothetical protein